jgi:phosphohistidine phosphatase
MNVFLVHHADAVGAHVDPQRGLSPLGRRQAEHLATLAKEAGVVPAAIWHSGKLRSRQTAEAFLRTCNPFASFSMVRGLAPEDPVDWTIDALEAESADTLLVGHMPHISVLAARLARGSDAFPVHGMVWLERTGPRTYVEQWRGESVSE